jgi:endonuclease-3
MKRGAGPRQPSKLGRQNAVRAVRGGEKLKSATTTRPVKTKSAGASEKLSAKPAAKKTGSNLNYDPLATDRISALLRGLEEMYPNVRCALNHSSAWELLVATILSAQCTDARVNMVTPILFKKYPTVQDFAVLKPEELEPDIKSTGFFRNKAKSVVGAAKKLVAEFNGEVPTNFDQLLSLPGVARKTANVVLGSWFGIADGVVVDTHVHRISRRLELTTNDDPVRIEQDLMRIVPRKKWIDFSHEVIHHGRALCMARTPRCADCKLETNCHAGDKTWSTVQQNPEAC